MSTREELYTAKNFSELEFMAARKALSIAQSNYAKAKKKHRQAIDAWVTAVERGQ